MKYKNHKQLFKVPQK